MKSAFIGPPRSGKTLTTINLSKYFLDNNLISEIILISPTFENNPFHVLNIPEENIISELDDIQNILSQVNEYCKSEVEKWKILKMLIIDLRKKRAPAKPRKQQQQQQPKQDIPIIYYI